MMAIAWALVGAEAIKLRRTVALWLAVGAPALAILLELSALFNRFSPPRGDAGVVWRILLQGGWLTWLGFCLPMLISFEAACLANVEHSGKHWKQIFAFPIPRWSVFATKMSFCGLLAWGSILVGVLGFVGDVLIYSHAGGLHLASVIPWSEILHTAGKAYMASCLLVVIQTWISARFPGIAAPVGIGFAALSVGLVVSSVRDGVITRWYPWTLPLSTIGLPGVSHSTVIPAVLGCVGGVAFGALACWDLARRDELF
jgi:hypothetical protein